MARRFSRHRWRVLALALLLLALALPVGAQDAARGTWVERQLESLVPGLGIQGLRNPLSSSPGFARLTLSDQQGVWLEIEEGSVEWSPTALLRRRVEIRQLTAQRLVVHRAPVSDTPAPRDAPPGQLIPDLPELPVAVRVDRLRIERLQLDEALLGEPVALSATGGLRLDDAGLDLSLDASLIEGGAVLTLQATLRPGTGRLNAAATLRGDAGGALSRVAGLGERPIALDLTLDGPSEQAAFTLRATAGEGVSADVEGTLAAPDTSRLGVALTGQVDASGLLQPPLARLAGPVEIRLDTSRMPDGVFDLRTLRVAGDAGSVAAQGRLDLSGPRSQISVAADLAASDAFAGLLPPDTVGWQALRAEGQVSGPLDAPLVALTAAPEGFTSAIEPLQALLGAAPRVTLRAAAPDRIEAFSLTGQALEATAEGRVGETLDLTFAANVSAPEAAVPGLTGALSLQGTATGPVADPTLTVTARSDRLEAAGRVLEALSLDARIANPATRPDVDARLAATLQELPVALSLRGTPEDAGWLRLQSAEARLGPARLAASGRVQPTALLAEGEARLEAEQLAPLGRLLGQQIEGALTLQARGSVENGTQRVTAELSAPRFAGFGVTARDVSAKVEGPLDALDVALAGTANEVQAEARGRVLALQDGARRVELAALRATTQGETIRLAAPTRVTLRPDGAVEIAETRLALPRDGTLRAEGTWGPERADIRATLASLNLGAFAPLVPAVNPVGTLTGEARITGPVASPEITASLRGRGLRAGPEAARALPPAELRLDLQRTGAGLLTADADLRVGPQQRLAATARFPQGPGAAAPFEATLNGNVDLAALTSPFLAAGADRVTGRLTLALRASGTLNAPVLGGEARLANGSYRNPVTGVNISQLAGVLRPDGQRLRADLTGRAGNQGTLALNGTIAPLEAGMPVDLQLVAANAQPIASDLIRATLDAELRLVGQLAGSATLGGPVRIRRAEIRIPESLPAGVRVLEPVREIGTPPGRAPRPARRVPAPADAAEPAAGPVINLAIAVNAPRNVYVRGRGLDAELGGELAVGGTIAAPDITGDLEMRRGDITVIGRRIAFDRGRLDWRGGLLPELDLRATSQVGGVNARVEVTGSPTQPQIVFSSTPELPQDEVLARLLFDRPLRQLSPFEIAQIASVLAGAAGLPGGDAASGFLERIRRNLGLDRLAVGSESERASRTTSAEDRAGATLEAGRYVAEGVYVGVKQGTEPGSSRVGVRVDLGPRLRLEAETGDREAGNRVGLSYEWEWGR
ncbi:translocation/assembly module TamB domain-containing protein [Falsiroseomonas bella]|uniref:translocation/assembly module TamB domain-containing protein n=1 Tax=Falsiroseomonas bella TaxID=2184016 RepID=UPI0011B656F5|nr:translocation/assembly module TamB domain-containing protein [Falsiroseomonas bella]